MVDHYKHSWLWSGKLKLCMFICAHTKWACHRHNIYCNILLGGRSKFCFLGGKNTLATCIYWSSTMPPTCRIVGADSPTYACFEGGIWSRKHVPCIHIPASKQEGMWKQPFPREDQSSWAFLWAGNISRTSYNYSLSVEYKDPLLHSVNAPYGTSYTLMILIQHT